MIQPPASSRSRSLRHHALVLLGLLLASARPSIAQTEADPLRFMAWPVQDATGLVSGFSSAEMLGTAGVGVALLVLSRYDAPLTERTARIADGTAIRVVEEFGNVRVVRPVQIAVFAGALLSGDHRFQDAAFTSLESVLFANTITNLLKSAVGRARPYEDIGAGSVAPFSGDRSFPSGHATTAFSFLAPWFFYYPGPVTGGLLVVATATSFSRMATNQHWFTDVVGGSAVGFLTAFALSRRHARIGSTRVIPRVVPAGVALEFRF